MEPLEASTYVPCDQFITPVMQLGTVPVIITMFSDTKQKIQHEMQTIACHTVPRNLIVPVSRAGPIKSGIERGSLCSTHKEYDNPVVGGYVNDS